MLGRLRLLLVLALLASALQGPANATQFGPAQYWQHIGYSFEPCATIQWRPNLTAARAPATMRTIIGEAIAVWNKAIGRTAMTLGPDTTAPASRRFDLTNVIEVQTSSSRDFGGVGGPSSITIAGNSRITEADIEIYDFDGRAITEQDVHDILLLTVIHEIGHGVGFLHTVDPDSPMSYVSSPGPTMDVDTAAMARFFLTAPCNSYPTASSPYDIGDSFARAGKRVDFGQISRTVQPLLKVGVASNEAVGVSLAHLRLNESAPVTRAVVCRDDLFADCLAGSSLAGSAGLIVFVPGGPSGSLPTSVRDVLRRAFAANPAASEVMVVGGPNAVSDTVQTQLSAQGYAVRRIADTGAGPDRYGTAAAIANNVITRTGDASTIYIARGDNPVDAMTAGVAAARDSVPLVLTQPGALPEKTRAFLAKAKPARIVILGGPAAVGKNVESALQAYAGQVDRVYGTERTATSVAIARDLVGYTAIQQAARPITLLNGRHPQAWALALGFASLGAVTGSPILLTEPDGYLPATAGGQGISPGSGRYLADLDLAKNHDGAAARNPAAFFQLLGTEDGNFTPLQALRYADQILLYCRWYFGDC